MSPWLDSTLFNPVADDLATLQAQTHRRYIKSHLPFDALPVWDTVKYIHVGRDRRDARLSWQNHEEGFTPASRANVGAMAMALAAEQGERPAGPPRPAPRDPREFLVKWFDELEALVDAPDTSGSTRFGRQFFGFEETYWRERQRPNLLLVHYNDLKEDLAGEMQRIAGFLDITVPENVMPSLVEAAHFESMKKAGYALIPNLQGIFDRGADRFINKARAGAGANVSHPRTSPATRRSWRAPAPPGLEAGWKAAAGARAIPKCRAIEMTMIDVKAFIDDRPIAPFLWALVAMCFLVIVADGMDVAIMGFARPSILQDWKVSRPAFGFVISAAPLGLVIGALIAGPLSDRLGRKIVMTTAVFLFGIFTVIAAGSSSPQEMALLRLLAGMGMGAAMPNAATLLAEYAPQRHRSLLITIMFSGFGLGSAAIGFIAGAMIPHFGWRSVLLVGGIAPLLLFPFLVALLPESARYMALQGAPAHKIAAMLGRVTGASFAGGETFVSPEPVLQTRRPIGVLFSQGYAATTIALWIACFMSLMAVYLLTGWLPTLMKDAGLTITAAADVTAMFLVGATIGAVLIGWRMDRGHPSRVIGAAYLAGALFIMGVAWVGALSGWLAILVFAAGLCIGGAQSGLNAFAPGCYPTLARNTGVAWMLGMGRLGSIAGSLVGGALLGLGWRFGAILGLLAIPALCAAIAITSTRPAAARHRSAGE